MLLPPTRWSKLSYISLLVQPKQLISFPLPFICSPKDEFRRRNVRTISCNHLAPQNFLFLLPGIFEQLSVMTQDHIFCENLKVVPLPPAGRREQDPQKALPAGANPVWSTCSVCCKSVNEWELLDIHRKRSALASNFRCKLHTTTDAFKRD